MKIRNYFFITLLFVGLASCLEEVKVSIRTESSTLVVDGGITNEAPPYSVRLSYSGNQLNANDINQNLAVSGARVILQDDTGDSVVLSPSYYEKGVYRTSNLNFKGQVGRSYSIKIDLKEGKTYISKPERLSFCPLIDSLYSVYMDIINTSYPDGYQIYVNAKDPVDTQNYYRWSAYGYSRVGKISPEGGFLPNTCGGVYPSNFCWVPLFQTQINILSDIYVNGNPIRNRPVFFSPVYAVGKHFVEVTQYSISREAYQFWKLYDEQATRTGTVFDPLPAPIVGNLVNKNDPNDYALGYFEVAGVNRKKLIIDGRNNQSEIYLNAVRFTPTEGGCSLPYASCDRPSGWTKD